MGEMRMERGAGRASRLVRLRRFGHIDCEHDIPIDVRMDGLPRVGQRIVAPEQDWFLLVIEVVRLEPPVRPAIHAPDTEGVPEWELRVLKLNEEQLLNAAIESVFHTLGSFQHDPDDDTPLEPLLN